MVVKSAPIDEVSSSTQNHGYSFSRNGRSHSFQPDMKGILTGMAIMGAAWLMAAWLNSGSPSSSSSTTIYPEQSALNVYYKVQRLPNTLNHEEATDIAAIQFQPTYILLKKQDGGGVVVTADQLREFSWSQQK